MIVKDGYNPDIIVGIARGGLVPARMVADYLFKKDLLSIKTEYEEGCRYNGCNIRIHKGVQQDNCKYKGNKACQDCTGSY